MFAFLLAGMPLGFAMVGAGFIGCIFFIDFNAALHCSAKPLMNRREAPISR